MKIQSLFTPAAWVNTMVLAGLGVLTTATTIHADDASRFIDHDAVAVTTYIGDDEVSQPVLPLAAALDE